MYVDVIEGLIQGFKRKDAWDQITGMVRRVA